MQLSELRHRCALRLGALAIALSLVAFAWPTWLEPWIGKGGDGGDGSLEYVVAAGLAVTALVLMGWPVAAHHRAVRAELLEVRHGR